MKRAAAANFVGNYSDRIDYGNQPSMGMAHLFNYSGAPWLAQKWVREVKERTFGGATPDLGYRGDEDQGQAGALSVLMAIGLFQVRGGAELDPVYEITSPIFDRVTIHLDPDYYPGREFVIVARNNSARNRYIQSAALNGRPLDQALVLSPRVGRRGHAGTGPWSRAEQAMGEPPRGCTALDDAGALIFNG